MSAHWKGQLHAIITLSRDRIRRIEVEARAASSLSAEAIGQIEAEEKNIARLQRTMDALS